MYKDVVVRLIKNKIFIFSANQIAMNILHFNKHSPDELFLRILLQKMCAHTYSMFLPANVGGHLVSCDGIHVGRHRFVSGQPV